MHLTMTPIPISKSLSGIAPIGAGTGSSGTAQTAGASNDFASILADFQKEAAKTPAERAHDAVLKDHHLSEDQYRALPKDQKDSIDREVALAVRRATQQNGTASSPTAPPSAAFSI
ncbi:MAG: hypothetical protein JWR80_1070 [Bradyrhizobium sp.]|nr:hypothetical protein [Bradyrhizobium sp.]